jgi:outer membrane lipoprotein carrier protein
MTEALARPLAMAPAAGFAAVAGGSRSFAFAGVLRRVQRFVSSPLRGPGAATAQGAGRFAPALALVAGLATPAWADPVETLRSFVRDVGSGRAAFTQTVTAADNARARTSSGSFEFQRPNRFRFEYLRPFEQSIVADGHKVWIYDPDLQQASSRRIADALGDTPAALLAGGGLDEAYTLQAAPPADGLQWVLARPKAADGPIQSLRVGFDGATLAALEIIDSFGQRSLLRFSGFEANVALPDERFRFTPPPGADVIEQ